jgi:Transposase DDE domain group 1
VLIEPPEKIKEGNNAVKWTKQSCRRFKDNAARLQLFALAYNLANLLRQLVQLKPIKGWTLMTLREKLIKIGAKVVVHAKYITSQLAEMAAPRQMFAGMLERIGRLRLAEASG